VDFLVAISTQSDDIFFAVASLLTSELNMVDLQCIHPTATLASPRVTLQNSSAEL